MAPWYRGATPCGFFAVRWDSSNKKDSIYTALNQIDNAEFRHFDVNGQPAGHDNYNYIVSTWQHVFNPKFLFKLEGYYMWQHDASWAARRASARFSPTAAAAAMAPCCRAGRTPTAMSSTRSTPSSKNDFVSWRAEWWHDERGMRSGFPGLYLSSTIGYTHFFSSNLEVRPEVGYYRNMDQKAFDNGNAQGAWIAGCDLILRF